MSADGNDEETRDWSVEEFAVVQHLYERLRGVVVSDLEKALCDHGLTKQVHGRIASRVKEHDSFRTKIALKRYADPINETSDLLGVRIVCLYPSVVRDIDRVIRGTFNILRYDNKSKSSDPERWRYSSVHYDCQLTDSARGQDCDDIKDLTFEIQVRTILQDAWATVEHQLGYKSPRLIPDELRREFSALAGLFHVADERFQFIANEIGNLERAQAIAKELGPLYRLAIDAAASPDSRSVQTCQAKDRIIELESKPDGIINRGSVKALLHGVYTKRQRKRNRDYALLAQDLVAGGVTSLADLGQLLLSGDRAARESEREQGPLGDVAFARVALAAASPAFQNAKRRRRTP